LDTWTQNYDPTGSLVFSTLLAALPIVVLLGLLGLCRWSAPRAAAAGLLTALVVSVVGFDMPWRLAFAAAGHGAAFGLFPIGWIVFCAVFLYALTVQSGQFEVVKASVASLSADRRLQAILIAFSFGAFVEGAAGFGTPVAISAALMIGAGFAPLYAAGLALIANTAPVAFGALGTPIITLARVTGLPEADLSAMAGRQLPFFSLIVPAWMVCTMSGWRGLKGVWPAVLVSGGSFAIVQFIVANWFGPTLVDVAGGLISLVLLALFLKIWKPKEIWHFPQELSANPATNAPMSAHAQGELDFGTTPDPRKLHRKYRASEIASAWVPWIVLSLCVFVWGMPQIRTFLDGGLTPAALEKRLASDNAALWWWERPNRLAGWSALVIEVPGLHAAVRRAPPAAAENEKPEEAIFRFNWLSATGTGIFVAAVVSALWLGVRPYDFARVLMRTLYVMRWPLFTIAAMLAIAYVTRYSGTDVTLGLAFTKTGTLYPFFAAMLGWLGVALTGSDTSSNALFGSLQKVTAQHLGLNPVLICAANSTGGVMGKMIDAQSIVVSAAATNQQGGESEILRFVFWHSILLAALMGLLTLAQAYWLSWMVPG
jgi:lactate permease